MKRLHVHLSVSNLEASIEFYRALFNEAPSVVKGDYAKWMLEDPRVNFAISTKRAETGLDHLGIQVEDKEELNGVSENLKAARMQIIDSGKTTCCYAESEKAWVIDPQGIPWETFLTTGEATQYGVDSSKVEQARNGFSSSCCSPAGDEILLSIEPRKTADE